MEAIDVRGGEARERASYRHVGRYLLCDEIASGGMATVHLGCLVGAGGFTRSVAIKRLFPQFARDPEFVAMFLDEARLAARVFHPNVISIVDVVEDGPDLFLVMDYVRGAPLSLLNRRARERNAPAPPAVAARILCSALSGLHAAHEAVDTEGARLEIVHRDVSPQNILVGADGVARVFDFGIAKAAGRLQTTRAGQVKGKLAYMAPEQISDDNVCRLADVYAAAVVYWETLTGRRLFHSADERTTLSKVLTAPVPAPSSFVRGLSPALDGVVLRGLARDPSHRYPTAYEMVREISKYSRIASSSEVGEWVASLAKDDLARCDQLATAIERLPPRESASRFAERLALTARDSCTQSVTRLVTSTPALDPAPPPPELEPAACADARSSVAPASLIAPTSRSSPVAERRRHLLAAVAIAVALGGAPTALGRCVAASDSPASAAVSTTSPASSVRGAGPARASPSKEACQRAVTKSAGSPAICQ